MKKVKRLTVIFLLLWAAICFTACFGVAPKDESEKIFVTVSVDAKSVACYAQEKNASVSDFIKSERGDRAIAQAKKEVETMLNAVKAKVDFDEDEIFYTLVSGFSGSMQASDLSKIKNIKGVSSVTETAKYQCLSVQQSRAEINDNNLFDTQGLDYHGEGMIIGVLDSGLNVNHDAFSIAPTLPKVKSSAYLEGVISNLNAHGHATAADLYKSDKIIYGYDYANNDTDIAPDSDEGNHGNHVASIAAGNGAEYKGVAYEAQIAFAKVFDDDMVAREDVIISAMEDMVVLGVDIVNASLGTVCGGSQSKLFVDIIKRGEKSGTVFCCSAGNSDKTTDSILNPDNATVNSPASTEGSFAVANFSSSLKKSANTAYGPSPSLDLKPDISGVGVNVYGAYSGNGYARQSGASMATPNVAGALALLKQKYAQYPSAQISSLLKRLTMSTATVMRNDGESYSPRLQGAGMLNLTKAIDADAYIRVDGSDYAKLNLGSDKDKSGEIKASLYIVNGGEEREFALSLEALTTSYAMKAGKEIIAEEAKRLYPEVEFFVGGKKVDTVTVASNQEQRIDISITLTQRDKEHLALFPNGTYVEGYIYCGDLSVPFLSYHGDWAEDIPLFDTGVYEHTELSYAYANGAWADEQSFRVQEDETIPLSYFGEPIAFNIKTHLLRNANSLQITLTDISGKKVFVSTEFAGGTKYNSQNRKEMEIQFTLNLSNIKGIKDGNKYLINLRGEGDYGKSQMLSCCFGVDTQNPTLSDLSLDRSGEQTVATLKAKDNGKLKRIEFLYNDGEYKLIKSVIVVSQPSEQITVAATFETAEQLYIRVVDEANNYTTYRVNDDLTLTAIDYSSAKLDGRKSDKRDSAYRSLMFKLLPYFILGSAFLALSPSYAKRKKEENSSND